MNEKNELPDVGYVTANGIRIGYREYGSGAPLLMITGYTGRMADWDPRIITALAAGFRVIVFDNRGMGETGADGRPFSIELFAEDTRAFLDALGIARVHLCGHSMGSFVAQELAIRYPERVDGLVLVSTLPAIEPRRHAALTAFLGEIAEDTAPVDLTLRRLYGAAYAARHPELAAYLRKNLEFLHTSGLFDPASIRGQRQAILSWPGSVGRLDRIRADTLVLVGTDDELSPPEDAFRVAAGIPGCWLVQVRGAGHDLFFQAPDLCAAAIRLFLTSLELTPRPTHTPGESATRPPPPPSP
ncbi:alpha/beta fold hydrolase [Methanofollis formosanus]|uniref:Alpha/beta fold hydrolase n=1 Tax=Methanofollis formosanus TaxID=299308 RepID=A0A8G1A0S0_9EURY|nr:alpha/beta fold hydrolase [Methanofollis formosanus]QYZ78891.1 alpha/beta fold hydrolase [Methanofollis formosanus]